MNAIRTIILNGLGLASLFGATSASLLQAQETQDDSQLNDNYKSLRLAEPARLKKQLIEIEANALIDPWVQQRIQERLQRRLLTADARKHQEFVDHDRDRQKTGGNAATTTHNQIQLSKEIKWPPALETPANKERRHRVQILAYRRVQGCSVGEELAQAIRDLDADLRNRVADIRPVNYIRAKRFLEDLTEASEEIVSSELVMK